MKGSWIPNLIRRVNNQTLSYSEAFGFILWRFGIRKSALRIEGLLFNNVDRIHWGLISNIFINQEYTARGFEIQPNDVVIDIGAHKGTFVGFAANRTKNLIIAFEPDPQNFKYLEGFIHDNQIKNVEIKNFAVDTKSGETDLYLAQSSSRHTITGIDQLNGDPLFESIKVKTLTLSDIINSFDAVDFLKMDCEGAEIGILIDSEERTLRKIRHLIAEVHWMGNKDLLEALKERIARVYSTVIFEQTSENLGVIYASFDKIN